MAEIAKPPAGQASLASLLVPDTNKISGLIVGEDVAQGDACYINTDGKVYRSTGAAATAPAKVRGYADMPAKAAQAQAITLLHGVELSYPNTLNPGADLFLSGTVPGGFATVASTGGTAPIGFVIDANRIFVIRSTY